MKNHYLLLVLIWLLGAPVALAQVPVISGLNPVRNRINAPLGTNVGLTFSQSMSSGGATLDAVHVFSSQRGGQLRNGQGGVTSASGSTLTFNPTTNFKPGETVFTTVTSAALSNGGTPLARGHVHQFTTQVIGMGGGNFTAPAMNPDPAVGSQTINVALGDVDGDGDLDFVTANAYIGTVSVRLNDGTGNFTPPATNPDFETGNSAISVALGDVDGDGDLDLVCANANSDNVSVRLNDGGGNFTPPATNPNPAVGISPISVALGDVDGDGDLDLLTANLDSNTVSIRLNDGTGNFTAPPTNPNPAVGSLPYSVALGDVDGDGDLDLVCANYGSNTVSVRINDGGGNFTAPAINPDPAVGTNPVSVALGDIDGDGDLDLVCANLNNANASVRINDGGGNFTPPATNPDPAVGNRPYGVALGDVDGDGDLDLLATNNNTNRVSVWINDGGGNFTPPAINPNSAVGSFPRGIALGDVDGDGDLDLLTANQSGNSVSVRLNQSVAPTITGFVATSTSVCVGSPITFTATLGNVTLVYNYTLTNGSSTSIAASTSNTPFSQTLLANESGSQSFSLIVNDNDQSTFATTNVTVNSLPTAGLTNNGPLSCTLTNVTLTASGGGSYTFVNGSGNVLSGSGNTRTVSAPGTYSVRVANAGGCISNASTTVAVGASISQVINPATTTATVGLSFTQSFSVVIVLPPGQPTPAATPVTLESGMLPGGLTLSSTGVLSGTPTQGGSFSFTVRATLPSTGCSAVSPVYRLVVSTAVVSQPIRYVKQDGAGTGDGTSWANASADLQSQIDAPSVEQVWVAAGLYKPTTIDRTISFTMRNGVEIYGGFPATGSPAFNQRGAVNPVTGQPSSSTLSGEIGDPSTTADNSYHVINNQTGITSIAVLDGFVITGGNANGSDSDGNNVGGGMTNLFTSPTVRNCSFQANTAYYGGGLTNQNSTPILTNCSFQANTAAYGGGGMANLFSSNPSLTNCRFQDNTAASVGGGMLNQNNSSPSLNNCSFLANTSFFFGGGMLNFSSSNPSLTNCSFQANTASGAGGGMHNGNTSTPSLTNCSFQSNTATNGGGLYITAGSSASLTNCSFQGNSAPNGGAVFSEEGYVLTNCVLFGNDGANTLAGNGTVTMRHCLIEATETDYTDGGNNITTTITPFASTISTQLNGCSPAINAGLNSAAGLAGITTDLAGNPRRYNSGTVDMGAYEYQGNPTFMTTTSPTVNTATIGAAFSQTFTTSGGGAPSSFTVVSGTLPTGLNLSTSGVLSGTPTQSGSFTIVIRGTDVYGCTALSPNYVLTVNALSPTITDFTASPNVVCSGSPVTFTATVGNVTGSYNYTLTNGSSPQIGTATGTFSLNVPASGSGSQSFTLLVSNGGQPATAVTSLTVGQSGVTRLYVKANATGANTGLSWEDAFTDLQSALKYSCIGSLTEIWIARGVYKPSLTGNRQASFQMLPGVAIYGGFEGTEPDLSQRPPITLNNPSSTTLSGDVDNDGTPANNSYNIILNVIQLTNTAILDGAVISSPTSGTLSSGITNRGRTQGGGVSSPLFRNLLFSGFIYTGNFQTSNGLLVYNDAASGWDVSPTFVNCVFRDNQAQFPFTGQFYSSAETNSSARPQLINCVVTNNTGDPFLRNQAAGGLVQPTLINSTFLNIPNGVADVSNNSSINMALTNCVLWNTGGATTFQKTGPTNAANVTVQYSLMDQAITGYTSGPGNLTATSSPFVSAGDLNLPNNSPAVNAGNPASVTVPNGPYTATNLPTTDAATNPRIIGSRVDMGALEAQNPVAPAPTITGFAASPSTVCVGSPVTFTATIGNFTGDYGWSLSNGGPPIGSPGPTSAPSFSVVVAAISSGPQTYTLTVTSNGQSTTAAASVIVNSLPVANILTPANATLTCGSPTISLRGCLGFCFTDSSGHKPNHRPVDNSFSMRLFYFIISG